jgi:hypothetical protein
MFVFDVLSGRVGSPKLLSLVNVIASRYRSRVGDFLQIDYHTNYGVHEPLNDAVPLMKLSRENKLKKYQLLFGISLFIFSLFW